MLLKFSIRDFRLELDKRPLALLSELEVDTASGMTELSSEPVDPCLLFRFLGTTVLLRLLRATIGSWL